MALQGGHHMAVKSTISRSVSSSARLVALLPETPQRIVCTIYADNTGVPGDNRWLGDRRAKTLCAALEQAGVKAKKTVIVSRGALDPRAPNTTAAGRERNRRADITITY
jgi:outer membrane protein OmpA-like peptidoglycan-associated protein